jgi:thymidylate synthase
LKEIRPDILEYGFEDLELLDYDPHPHIAAPVAV